MVKSAPELWSEVSEAASLKRHLDQFGEIQITRLEPETVVAWEGKSARGTVKLEPSGWGTKVILTAAPAEAESDSDGERTGDTSTPDPIGAEMRELQAVLERGKPTSKQRVFGSRPGLMRSFLAWLKGGQPDAVEGSSAAVGREADEVGDTTGSAAAPARALNSALDSLGRAHHRPYSRG